MKIYNEVLVDMATMETISENSFEYEGPLIECKGGGGGGSSSGAVDFPEYLKLTHTNMLTGNTDLSTILLHFDGNDNLFQNIENGVAVSPYQGEIAYDPDSDITNFLAELADYSTAVDAVDELIDWISIITNVRNEIDANVIDNTSIDEASDAHGKMLDDRLVSEVLPRFETGMRDINAVISSSFVIGKSILEAFNTREVADFDKKLRVQSYGQRNQLIMQGVTDSINILNSKLNFRDALTRSSVESYRVKAVLKKEELEEQLDMEDKEFRWPLELFQYGANALGSISGSAVSPHKGPTKMQSTLGGAMSGAAAGASVSGGNPWVSGAGAVIGGIGGLLQ